MSLESLIRNAKRKVKNTLLGAALLASPYISFACGGNPNPPAPNNPPVISTTGNNPVNEGELVEVQLSAVDSDGDYPISFIIQNPPAGAVFDIATNKLRWAPDFNDGDAAPGIYTLNLQATDSRGAVANSTYDVVINDVVTPDRILCNTNYPGGVSILKLASMLPDGMDLRSIGKAGEEGTRPRYFPLDNTKMSVGKGTFLGGSCLEDIADGANQVLISDSLPIGQSGTAVSPDGTLVAQNDDRLGYRAVHLFDRATAAYIGKLTPNTVEESSPVFSPDGQWVYFAAIFGSEEDIYRMKADRTGGVENLTNTPSYSEFAPDVSPDGTKLIYSLYDSSTIGQIYEKNSDGSGVLVKITNVLGDASADYSGATWPNYSPDGNKIAFIDYSITGGVMNYANLIVLYEDGSGNWAYSKTISNPSFEFFQPDW